MTILSKVSNAGPEVVLSDDKLSPATLLESPGVGGQMLKIGLFVDIPNQVEALTHHKKGYRINYKKLMEYLSADGNLIWTSRAYGIYLTDDGISFIQVLGSLGYKPSFIKVKRADENPNRVPEMMLDIIDAYPKLDIVVIGSNSPDFCPLIHWLQSRSVRVWIVTPQLHHDSGDVKIDLLKIDGVVEKIESIQKGHHSDGTGQGSSQGQG